MKILIDTNVLFSALLFPSSKPAQALEVAHGESVLFITSQIFQEFFDVVQRKSPKHYGDAQPFLDTYSFKVIPDEEEEGKTIRDETDQPILDAAIAYDIDIIITGDKDFLSLKSTHPLCLSPADFLVYEKENHDMFIEETIWHES